MDSKRLAASDFTLMLTHIPKSYLEATSTAPAAPEVTKSKLTGQLKTKGYKKYEEIK